MLQRSIPKRFLASATNSLALKLLSLCFLALSARPRLVPS